VNRVDPSRLRLARLVKVYPAVRAEVRAWPEHGESHANADLSEALRAPWTLHEPLQTNNGAGKHCRADKESRRIAYIVCHRHRDDEPCRGADSQQPAHALLMYSRMVWFMTLDATSRMPCVRRRRVALCHNARFRLLGHTLVRAGVRQVAIAIVNETPAVRSDPSPKVLAAQSRRSGLGCDPRLDAAKAAKIGARDGFRAAPVSARISWLQVDRETSMGGRMANPVAGA
jgi:hypothetical protein